MTALVAHLPFDLLRQHRSYLALIAVWALSMISLPILRWTRGDDVVPLGVMLAVLAQVAVSLSVVWRSWGVRRALLTLLAVTALGWLVEFIGSQTGFPFGPYRYTDRLQPQLGGVPLLIPLAWFMMMPAAWAVAELLVGTRRHWQFVTVSALAFTAWDLFLDPQMVAWDFWTWAEPSGYFSIPWVNFLGWLLASGLITAIVRPVSVPALPLVGIYGLAWFFETVGLIVFWGLPGPGLVGSLVMGTFLLLAVRALRRGDRS